MIFIKRGEIKRVLVWDGSYIWIEKRDGRFFAYSSHSKALLGIVSPSLEFRYTQEDLEQAFKSNFMIK